MGISTSLPIPEITDHKADEDSGTGDPAADGQTHVIFVLS